MSGDTKQTIQENVTSNLEVHSIPWVCSAFLITMPYTYNVAIQKRELFKLVFWKLRCVGHLCTSHWVNF